VATRTTTKSGLGEWHGRLWARATSRGLGQCQPSVLTPCVLLSPFHRCTVLQVDLNLLIYFSSSMTTASFSDTVSGNNTQVCTPQSVSYLCLTSQDCIHSEATLCVPAHLGLDIQPPLGVCNCTSLLLVLACICSCLLWASSALTWPLPLAASSVVVPIAAPDSLHRLRERHGVHRNPHDG
jgi:hypothetical protein